MCTETVGPDRKLAERARAEREAALNSGRFGGLKRLSFDAFRQEELQLMRGRLADGTVDQIRIALMHFSRACEPGRMADIDLSMVEQFYAERLKEVSEATANKDLRHLKASFNRAVRRGYMCSNPANDLKPVREAQKSIRVLSPAEVGALMEAGPSLLWQTLIAVAVTTGLRRGELLALRWEDVDFERRMVRVQNTRDHKTKSRKNRLLALIPPVCGLLRELPRRGEFVFGTGDAPMRGDMVSRTFKEIVGRADIKHCTLHDLRRTFVSHLANAGVNAALVQQLAGHSAITTTVRYYTGVMPDALREAQARLPFDNVIGVVSESYHGPDEAADEGRDGKIVSLFSNAG